MNQKMKKLFSCMLGIMLLLGLIPSVAMAEEPVQSAGFSFNVTANVEKGSRAEAPYRAFYFQLQETAGDYGVELQNNCVETNGAGGYTKELTGTVNLDKVTTENGWQEDGGENMYYCDLKISERDDTEENWEYDKTQYVLQIICNTATGEVSARLQGEGVYTNIYTRDLNVEFSVPVTKTIRQQGTKVPGEQTFTLVLKNKDGKTPADYGIRLTNTQIATNGTGDFSANLTGVVDVEKATVENGWVQGSDTVFCGFYLTEHNDGTAGWTYSEQTYSLVVYYSATYGVRVAVNEKDSDVLTTARFTNIYTMEKKAEPTKPEETPKKEEAEKMKEPVKATKSQNTMKNKAPKTGDSNSQGLWGMLLIGSGVAVTGLTVYSRKKERETRKL